MAREAATFPFPVWRTQGGGLVSDEHKGGVYRFVEAPELGMNLKVGDPMPAEWGIAPANTAAMVAMEDMFAD